MPQAYSSVKIVIKSYHIVCLFNLGVRSEREHLFISMTFSDHHRLLGSVYLCGFGAIVGLEERILKCRLGP